LVLIDDPGLPVLDFYEQPRAQHEISLLPSSGYFGVNLWPLVVGSAGVILSRLRTQDHPSKD
jgi:hypothetical protein